MAQHARLPSRMAMAALLVLCSGGLVAGTGSNRFTYTDKRAQELSNAHKYEELKAVEEEGLALQNIKAGSTVQLDNAVCSGVETHSQPSLWEKANGFGIQISQRTSVLWRRMKLLFQREALDLERDGHDNSGDSAVDDLDWGNDVITDPDRDPAGLKPDKNGGSSVHETGRTVDDPYDLAGLHGSAKAARDKIVIEQGREKAVGSMTEEKEARTCVGEAGCRVSLKEFGVEDRHEREAGAQGQEHRDSYESLSKWDDNDVAGVVDEDEDQQQGHHGQQGWQRQQGQPGSKPDGERIQGQQGHAAALEADNRLVNQVKPDVSFLRHSLTVPTLIRAAMQSVRGSSVWVVTVVQKLGLRHTSCLLALSLVLTARTRLPLVWRWTFYPELRSNPLKKDFMTLLWMCVLICVLFVVHIFYAVIFCCSVGWLLLTSSAIWMRLRQWLKHWLWDVSLVPCLWLGVNTLYCSCVHARLVGWVAVSYPAHHVRVWFRLLGWRGQVAWQGWGPERARSVAALAAAVASCAANSGALGTAVWHRKAVAMAADMRARAAACIKQAAQQQAEAQAVQDRKDQQHAAFRERVALRQQQQQQQQQQPKQQPPQKKLGQPAAIHLQTGLHGSTQVEQDTGIHPISTAQPPQRLTQQRVNKGSTKRHKLPVAIPNPNAPTARATARQPKEALPPPTTGGNGLVKALQPVAPISAQPQPNDGSGTPIFTSPSRRVCTQGAQLLGTPTLAPTATRLPQQQLPLPQLTNHPGTLKSLNAIHTPAATIAFNSTATYKARPQAVSLAASRHALPAVSNVQSAMAGQSPPAKAAPVTQPPLPAGRSFPFTTPVVMPVSVPGMLPGVHHEKPIKQLPLHLQLPPHLQLHKHLQHTPAPPISAAPPQESAPAPSQSSDDCNICMERLTTNRGFMHAGSVHTGVCAPCCARIMSQPKPVCPFCMKPVQAVLDVF